MKSNSRTIIRIAAAAMMTGAAAGGAHAQIVTFPGTIIKSCVLTPSVGAVALSSAGTELGSEQSGGLASTMTVVATGGAATVTFAAPTMPTRPGTYAGTPTVSLKFSTTSGASQAYTSTQSSYTGSGITLSDTVTIDAKAVDGNGFPAGAYAVSTTATCSQ